MKEYGNLDRKMFGKQQTLQTMKADTFHENEFRRAMKQVGLSDDQVAAALQALHDNKKGE